MVVALIENGTIGAEIAILVFAVHPLLSTTITE